MLELQELSRIGFGCYRMSRKSREHSQALRRALANGCNLIDTAANYMSGDSERMIGEVLADHPQHHPFVITKAGYVQGEGATLVEELQRTGRACGGVVRTSAGWLHSIHPDFLDGQITLSCRRLQRSQVDGFLLHNPEYYFDQVGCAPLQSEYYARIKQAFEFLEEAVEQGRVRYYGVSSNSLPFSTADPHTTSLPRLLAVAEEVSTSNHFKLIQFPFNLVENEAQMSHHAGDHSLIEIARASGIITLTNRPLNANSANGPVRLASYEQEVQGLEENRDSCFLEECLRLVRRRLDELGSDDDVMEFVPLQIISQSWSSFSSTDMVDQFFNQQVLPFLDQLYEGDIYQEVLNAFAKLRQIVVLYAKKSMTHKAQAFRHQMIAQGLVTEHDMGSLPVIACQSYLDAGIDHVLVGMRKPQYVDSLSSLFRRSRGRVTSG
jgi:aryl-alcohol dehydrogenase-like predicted oxidoreductase